MPEVCITIESFVSVWLQSLVRRSDKLAALIPQLNVKGMSPRDIEAALSETLEVEGVSMSTVSVKTDGRKMLLHLAVGDEESAVCWKSVFEDMKHR